MVRCEWGGVSGGGVSGEAVYYIYLLQRQRFEDYKLSVMKERFLDSSVFHTTAECRSQLAKGCL